MRKIFTTLGCALALSFISFSTEAQETVYFNSDSPITLGGSKGTSCIVDGESLTDTDVTVGILTNSTTNIYNEISFALTAAQGAEWGIKELTTVKTNDGYFAYNSAQQFTQQKKYTFTYTGSEEVEFTFKTTKIEGEDYTPPTPELSFGQTVTLPTEDGVNKATYLDQVEAGQTAADYYVYLYTSSQKNLLEMNQLSFLIDGFSYNKEWTAVKLANENYAYISSINQNTVNTFQYNGEDPIEITLYKGVATEYQNSAEIETFTGGQVTFPVKGNQYVLSLNDLQITWPGKNLAAVKYGEVIGQAKIYRGTDNIENLDAPENVSWNIDSYIAEDDELSQEGDQNSVVLNLTGYTNPGLTDQDDPQDNPVPAEYLAYFGSNLVVDTNTGDQNGEYSFRFTILKGIEAMSQTTDGTYSTLDKVSVTFDNATQIESNDAVNCYLNGAVIQPAIGETEVSFDFSELGNGTYTLKIPATAFIVSISGDDQETNPDVKGRRLNEEFTLTFTITGSTLVPGIVSIENGTEFENGEEVAFDITFEGDEIIENSNFEGSYVVSFGNEEYDWDGDIVEFENGVVSINLGDKLAAGEYTVTLVKGCLLIDGAENAVVNVTFEVLEAEEPDDDKDQDTGAISSILSGASEGAIYNMQGVKVAGGKLAKGVYIVNGKKVILK